MVDASGIAGPAAEQALSEAANIAALHMLAARTASDHVRHQRGDLLRRVLADPGSAALVAPQLGLDPDAPVAVAAFIVVSSQPDGALAAHAAMRFTDLVSLHCEAHFGRHGCALIDGTVYALLPAHSWHSHRDLVTDIARRAQQALRVPIHAALGSQGCAGLRSAVISRHDADLVLRVLPASKASRASRSWPRSRTCGPARRSTELAQALSGTPRLNEGAGPALWSYDAEHGTAYASTLLAYLGANSDIAGGSPRLNVHPNTCRYRLARAEQISGIALASPDERLLLWLQLRLREELGLSAQ